MLSKEKALKLLNEWVSEKQETERVFKFPENNEVVFMAMSFDVPQTINDRWTLLDLVKCVYDE